jgi:hypothetical protein
MLLFSQHKHLNPSVYYTILDTLLFSSVVNLLCKGNPLKGYKTTSGMPFTIASIYTIPKNHTFIGAILNNVKYNKGNITGIIVSSTLRKLSLKGTIHLYYKSYKCMEKRTRSRGKVLSAKYIKRPCIRQGKRSEDGILCNIKI